MVERAQQIATGVSRHLSALIARSKNSQQIQALTDFSMRANGDACMAFLQGIHVMRVHDHTEQLAAVANLSNLVKKNPKGNRHLCSLSISISLFLLTTMESKISIQHISSIIFFFLYCFTLVT